MYIAEIFCSIQGEGLLAGTPSVFIRTSGCNLRCTWCDTPYTSWKPEGQQMQLGTILSDVRRNWGVRHVVVTGGEPMIVEDLVLLTQRLKEDDLHITIETAGTVFAPVSCDLMSISPKLANSTPRRRDGGRWAAQHERLRIQPDVLRRLMSGYPYQLKFVVSKEEDLAEIRGLIQDLEADPDRVLLMPEGFDPEPLHERSQWLAELCIRERFRFTPRLHIDLWGNERGR